MNDLYIHQLETENKQIREQLQICRNAINEIKEELNKTIDAKDKIIKEQVIEISKLKEKIDKAIDYIKTWLVDEYSIAIIDEDGIGCNNEPNAVETLLEILGDKENE